MRKVFFTAAIIVVAPASFAQEAAPPTQTVGPAFAAPAPVISRALPAATLLTVAPLEEISSKRIKEGQKVHFVTVGDVVDNGFVVIPRGSAVEGTISWKTGRAVGGKSGKFDVTFDTVSVRGQSYRLRGSHRQEGKGNTVAAVFASLVVSGRSAVMLPGQQVNAFTAEQIPY